MFTIQSGTRPGAIEILFDCKPDGTTRETLKANSFRWNAKKGVWYGFSDPETMTVLLSGATPDANQPKTKKPDGINYARLAAYTGETSDGYCGATRWNGCNSNKSLYGSNLSKAIRAALKDCSVSGVTVSVKSFSGGQEIILTLTPRQGDFVSENDYINSFYYDNGDPNYCKLNDIIRSSGWITYSTGNINKWGYPETDSIFSEKFYAMPDGDEKRRIFKAAIECNYKANLSDDINEYYYKNNAIYTDQFKARIQAIKQIVDSFNYDDSNSMVDYFNTNFYSFYKLKKAA